MATGGHTSISIVIVLALLGAGLASMAIPTVEAASTPAPLGIDMGNVAAMAASGAPARYGSYWVGQWMASSGWGGLDNALDTAVAKGVTPVVYWYYWGDSISPSCVDYGCSGKSQSQWTAMTATLADHIRTKMGGRETLVVLENEFNKNGIDGTYAPTFDAKLVSVAQTLKGVSGVKLILGFGNWGESNWAKFPRAAAESQYIGFQMMRASTKDSEASYRGAASRTVQLNNIIASNFGKPSFLYDLAFSSYPDANWETIQAQTLQAVFDGLTTSGATGLQGIVYRSLTDTYMDPANYYGLAESHWGLKRSDGSAKPAWNVWYAVATSAGGTPPPPPPTGPYTATFDTTGGGNNWWVQVTVTSTGTTNAVCASVDNGACQTLVHQTWGAWAASFAVATGAKIVFTATGADGTRVTSGAYSWPTGAAYVAPVPNAPPVASFTAVGGVLNATVDASASSDPEGKALSYAWTFGDGASGTGVRTTHAYTAAGSYSIKLTVSDGALASSKTLSVTVAAPAPPPPPPAPSTFTATFSPYGGNNWWVQTRVNASSQVASVCASVNGGACQPLSYQSWGAWAASFSAPTGSVVTFKATSTGGQSVTSGGYAWPSGTLVSAPAPAPTLSATFSPYGGNEWWVQTRVTSSAALKSVCASVNGGACQALTLQSWGAWAASIHAVPGARVVFTATSTTGATAVSASYVWPVK